jgi:hypothetical protein
MTAQIWLKLLGSFLAVAAGVAAWLLLAQLLSEVL